MMLKSSTQNDQRAIKLPHDPLPKFRTEILDKIRRMAEREIDPDPLADVPGDGVRTTIRQTLEKFQREIIRQNIWIRVYDDHANPGPTFAAEICLAVAEIIKNALQRHRSSELLAYVEISFSSNETGTVVTVEDNAVSLSMEETKALSFLQIRNTKVLPGGYTVQAEIKGTSSEVSVRCVTNCFTRFGICLPY